MTFIPKRTSLATRRLTKKAFEEKSARRDFVSTVAAVKPCDRTTTKANELVEQTRAAKNASFLDKYRAVAKS